jgi:hypothetical protein
LLADKTRSGSKADEHNMPGSPTPDVIPKLLRLFDTSPLGVLRALESPPIKASEDHDAEEDRLRSLVVEQLALALPIEFQRFRHLTRAQRAEETA